MWQREAVRSGGTRGVDAHRAGRAAARTARRRLARATAAGTLALTAVVGAGGWAAGPQQQPITGPPPGTAAWRADTVQGRELPDPATASPRRVAAFFASLSPDARRELAERHPGVVGNLDGAPVALRYAANALAYARHTGRPLPGERQLLAFDPRGRGLVTEVVGDLSRARRVAVVVPGSDLDLADHDGARTAARNLHARLERTAPGVPTAVVAWVGYTTPDGLGIDAATDRLAEAGAPRLTRFLTGLAATTDAATPALFCHSYGSLLCARADADRADTHRTDAGRTDADRTDADRADAGDVVFLGSPGTGLSHAADVPGARRVWATELAEADWVAHVPHVRLLGLGHGADPTDPAFGARVVSAAGAEGHDGYFAPGTASLAAYAAITLGRYDAVPRADGDAGGSGPG
ncbi:alpha/beta hydrolase [Streptomyces sp. TRM70308]|uniref:alpha/beta hydrolase n=1 Tax=Streptomyces sp. TRM70308 TaxID=3131932 RepID=UPI003CFCD78D